MNKQMIELFKACTTGHVGELKAVLKNCGNVNVKNEQGDTPLSIVSKCRFDLVKLLVEHGADVNLKSEEIISPLHWAVEYDNDEIVNYLLEQGADIGARDHSHEIPLHWAAWTGHHKVAKLLLTYGSSPLTKNGGGVTPLDLARRQEHHKLVELFEQHLLDG